MLEKVYQSRSTRSPEQIRLALRDATHFGLKSGDKIEKGIVATYDKGAFTLSYQDWWMNYTYPFSIEGQVEAAASGSLISYRMRVHWGKILPVVLLFLVIAGLALFGQSIESLSSIWNSLGWPMLTPLTLIGGILLGQLVFYRRKLFRIFHRLMQISEVPVLSNEQAA